MIVRKIKPEELKRTKELFAIAFEFEADNSKSAEDEYKESAENPKTREDFYWGERWAAYQDDNKTMMSYFVAKPLPVHYDGHHCRMIGIGGVATLPQYRRMGGIRACFEAALPDMYESGAAFSYLYPFSTAYYRKFGYEMCCERMQYQIKLNMIPLFPVDGDSFLVEPGCFMLDEIKQIYKVWQNKYNLMVENEEFEYAWVLRSDPVKDQLFTYVYKSKNGEAKGFMTFSNVSGAEGRNLVCTRFFYTAIEGFKGMMNLARSLASDHQSITFEVPADQMIESLLPEWSMGAGKCEKIFCGMVRVINVLKVLQMAKYKGDGSLVIQITDSYIKDNNNSFLIRFENGMAILVSVTVAPPDISLGIADFSRLITGVYGMDAFEFMESVHIYAGMDKIAKVFYQKPILITEFF